MHTGARIFVWETLSTAAGTPCESDAHSYAVSAILILLHHYPDPDRSKVSVSWDYPTIAGDVSPQNYGGRVLRAVPADSTQCNHLINPDACDVATGGGCTVTQEGARGSMCKALASSACFRSSPGGDTRHLGTNDQEITDVTNLQLAGFALEINVRLSSKPHATLHRFARRTLVRLDSAGPHLRCPLHFHALQPAVDSHWLRLVGRQDPTYPKAVHTYLATSQHTVQHTVSSTT